MNSLEKEEVKDENHLQNTIIKHDESGKKENEPNDKKRQQQQQQQIYKRNDFDLNNLSENDRKLICDQNLLYRTPYPKLIISLIQPKMLSFLQNVLPNLTQNQVIQYIIEYINLKYDNNKFIDTSGNFFEDILLHLDSKQEEVMTENRNEIKNISPTATKLTTSTTFSSIPPPPPTTTTTDNNNNNNNNNNINNVQSISHSKKFQKKKQLRNKTKSQKQIKEKKKMRKFSDNEEKLFVRNHHDVSKFGETIFRIS